MNVSIICLDILEGEEVTILGDRKLSNIKEVVEFIHSTIARILHKVIEEVEQGLERQVLLHEGDHSLGESIVNWLPLVDDDTIYNLDIRVKNKVLDLASNIYMVEEGVPILSLDCFKSLLIVGVCVINRVD
jgi:hypothetical protein